MWWSFFLVGNNPKYSTSWILLADVNQILCWIIQEVPPLSYLLMEDEGTSFSHVSHHHSWPLDQMGDWLYYMPPPSSKGHCYIIIAVEYFTKWVEVTPKFKYDGETTSPFLFNQIIARFDALKDIVTDHGSHFQNRMLSELTSNLGLRQENSSPYYP